MGGLSSRPEGIPIPGSNGQSGIAICILYMDNCKLKMEDISRRVVISFYCGKSGAMPTLAVGMIDFPEKHGIATQVWAWHPQVFNYPQQ
jgi:hypothetical protein